MPERSSSRSNFSYLTVALVCLLAAGAIADDVAGRYGQWVAQIAMVLALGAGVWSVRGNGRWFGLAWALVAAMLANGLIDTFLRMPSLNFVHLALMLGYFVLTAALAARQVFSSRHVDADTVIGSICIFLLLGLTWATLYVLISEIEADAFTGLVSRAWYENFPDLVYFSFVSLSTLGYGDILPVSPIARFLAYMEAIVGQFYLAILVVSLVGVSIAGARPRD